MISNHVFVFIYNFSVFIGLLSLGLCIIFKYRTTEKNAVPPSLIAFICVFFLYGFLNLLAYYQISILVNLTGLYFFPIAANFLYLFMYYLWIRFICSQAGISTKSYLFNALNILVGICCVLWTADNTWFLDKNFKVLNFSGTLASTISEIILFIMLIVFVIYYLINIRTKKRTPYHAFLIALNFPLIIYFIYTIIKDLRIIFEEYTVDTWFSNNISACALLSLVVNIFFIIYFSLNIRDRFMVINQFEDIVHNKTSKIKELASEYNLSERETDVLILIFEGKTNQEISDTLFISTNTVKKHINALLRKMELHNRVDIITKFR